MREPPLGLDAVPHPGLERLFDEILAAPTTALLLLGLYEVALPAVDAALEKYQTQTNPLADAPSRRLIRFARLELADMLDFGRRSIARLVSAADRVAASPWLACLTACVDAAGRIDGSAPTCDTLPEAMHSAKPFVYDPVPRRDERYCDLYNQGVNAEAFLYDAEMLAKDKALMMLYKRLREIDVPEMMASILSQTPDKPWGYYLAMTRQMWDEARHAMMGEVGFVALGIDWTKARVTFNWSMRLNTECTPLERHAVLYFIEQGLMPRTGKRYEYEVGVDSGIPLMATIQDFDWADEVLHASIGREWYVPQFGHFREALDYGDKAWSRITSNWSEVRDSGLTAHENWWPAIYAQACENRGESPDPVVLAWGITYEGRRADRKPVQV